MIAALIGIAYITLGFITAFVLIEYIEKKLGEGSSIGVFLIMYINIFIWPVFFPMMIHQTNVEAKKKGGEE